MHIRAVLLVLVLAVCPPALAYDVTFTLAETTGSPLACRLFMDGDPVTAASDAGETSAGDYPCGEPFKIEDLVSADGDYAFQYRLVKPDASTTALSPETVITFTTEVTDPTVPPNAVVECRPSPCPSHISITITP